MKPSLPRPAQYSYIVHRRQVMRQILLPLVLAALALLALCVWIGLAAFGRGADLGRWASISTIWIVIPAMLAGVLILAVLGGLIYLMSRVLGGLPHYTGQAQDYVHRGRSYILRAADLAVKPILALDGIIESIRAFLGRITP